MALMGQVCQGNDPSLVGNRRPGRFFLMKRPTSVHHLCWSVVSRLTMAELKVGCGGPLLRWAQSTKGSQHND